MPFLTLNATEYLVENFRRLPDEVSPAGVVARNWRADVFCETNAEAETLRSLASHNLRRMLGWQLRGAGAGDVTFGGDVLSAPATVRLSVEDDQFGINGTSWFRVLSVLIREQVTP